MKNNEIADLVGSVVETRITAGRFGDTSLTTGHFIVGDPCYWMPEADRAEFNRGWSEVTPESYRGGDRDWVSFEFRGKTVYARSCSDGVHFGHNVDSGSLACIPAELFPGTMRRFHNAALAAAKGQP